MNDRKYYSSGDQMHCVRTMLQKNTHLLLLADRKAGIMLGANFLMVSIFIAQIAVNGWIYVLVLPLCFSFIVIILTLMALSPRINPDEFSHPNHLFFDVVVKQTEAQFLETMDQVLSSNQVHETMLIDFYQTSMVLERKFKLLRICYFFCTALYGTYFFFSLFMLVQTYV